MEPKRQLIDVVPFAEQLTSIINENRQRFKNIPAMQEVIDLLEMAKGYALNQPIVDAVEVVHGRWIPINTIHKWRYLCNQCKHYVDAGTDRNYCPNCGAKMDGERRNNEQG